MRYKSLRLGVYPSVNREVVHPVIMILLWFRVLERVSIGKFFLILLRLDVRSLHLLIIFGAWILLHFDFPFRTDKPSRQKTRRSLNFSPL